ncbi:hypothetical protein TI39_contig298g00067 [Zymoseptoria brevis]|uniref:Uncharacterized protein n=1 Tax=Zymoseptoria brevis TaxID=1047168 RepID=A0A0F4GV08_9PEZI|nr:hypothetical protein TI39_contig298g00067 [Zymoseptoria brevis]
MSGYVNLYWKKADGTTQRILLQGGRQDDEGLETIDGVMLMNPPAKMYTGKGERGRALRAAKRRVSYYSSLGRHAQAQGAWQDFGRRKVPDMPTGWSGVRAYGGWRMSDMANS